MPPTIAAIASGHAVTTSHAQEHVAVRVERTAGNFAARAITVPANVRPAMVAVTAGTISLSMVGPVTVALTTPGALKLAGA